MKIYGYCRCSTDKQTVAHQRLEIKQYARHQNLHIDRWVEETISSRKPLQKRALGDLLKKLQADDILITSELSRLGRSLLEVMSILQYCLEKNCQVWTIKEHYRLGADIQSKVLAFAFGLSAEIERQLISDRTRSSLASLKKGGRKLGRPFGAKNRLLKLSKNRTKLNELMAQGLQKKEIAERLNVDKMTLYRFLKRQEEMDAQERALLLEQERQAQLIEPLLPFDAPSPASQPSDEPELFSQEDLNSNSKSTP
ncbi:MAG: master DNA invertase Mpi family serine-type recombinase [Alphaproteobacteria bacterium]|nr:master DNA invertase Mpi family serine-type recombinase [Alphaproteobacteria bacterium]